MVYYYTSEPDGLEPMTLYMGKEKEENELLIKHGWENDVWFHVDKMSSAHVYLRMPDGMIWDCIPEPYLIDCAQLTKANSIQGNKKDNVTVIYTPWSNLRKDGSMAVGQVGFTKERTVKRLKIPTRENAIINRLNKTKKEIYPDLEQEKIDHEKELRRQYAEEHRVRHKADLEKAREYKEKKAQKNHGYTDLFAEDEIQHNSNQFRPDDWEEDFM